MPLRVPAELRLAKEPASIKFRAHKFARLSSSLVYGVPPFRTHPHLTPETTHETRSSSKKSSWDHEISLVDDKVENWSSGKYAQYPFKPDFALFEPLEEYENQSTYPSSSQTIPSLEIDPSIALSARLVDLIEIDAVGAEELKSEILINRIELPFHRKITQHCFNLLLRSNDVDGYLEWLDMIPQSALQLEARQTEHIFDLHLKHLIYLCPRKLGVIQLFFNKIVSKGCLTGSLIRTIISHLVRTQSPETVLQFYHDGLNHVSHLPASQQNRFRLLDLCSELNDHTILQLANQRRLIEALDLFFNYDKKSTIPFMKTVSSSVHLVLADQLLLMISNQQQGPDRSSLWTDQLEKILLSWKLNHPFSFKQWLSSSKGSYPKLPHACMMSHKISISRHPPMISRSSLAHEGDLENTIHRLVIYFRTLLSQESNTKFVKSSHIAENIGRLISIGNLESSLKHFGYCLVQQDVEQCLKELVFDPLALQKFVSKAQAMGKTLDFEGQRLSSRFIKFRGDVILIWAHSWMIFYQRNQLYNKVAEIFLRYFVPIGVDREILGSRAGNASVYLHSPPQLNCTALNSISLIHPTTGVLSVLYNSILRSTPTKSIPKILASFIHLNLPNSSASPIPLDEEVILPKLLPNPTSFKPFLRAFLRIGLTSEALELIINVHSRLRTDPDHATSTPDEGLWINLLECCASQSAGSVPFKARGIQANDRWGSARKRKKLGWSGEMKERLVYSILDRLLQARDRRSVEASDLTINTSPLIVDPRDLVPKLFAQHLPWIDELLDRVDWVQERHLGGPSTTCRAVPSLKLLSRVRAGFEVCGNRRGAKVLRRLVKWRKGLQVCGRA